MKAWLVILCVLVAGLALTLVGTVAAQPLDDDGPPGPMFSPDHRSPLADADALDRHTLPAVAPDAPSGPAVGQPGLSFRFDRTYGTSGIPYFDDSAHLYHPQAVTVDGTNIWIGERFGRRAMKFTSGGTFVTQIGKSGLKDVYPRSMDEADDVAVDASGNVWVVDWGAAHVLKFDSSLKYVSELGQTWGSGKVVSDRSESSHGALGRKRRSRMADIKWALHLVVKM